ncbi:MAG: cupredoxin domain-containing protein [Candidatus Acidiferrales bacterium]
MDFQIELAHGAKAAPHNVSNHNLHVVAQPRCQMTTLMAGGLSPALVAIALWSAVSFSHPKPVSARNASPQVIEVTAKKYEYSPAPIHVKSGVNILLKITATDHDHGFSILTVPDGASPGSSAGLVFTSPQDCWQLKKGETTTIEFLAQTPGTYSFKCCHVCGLGHRGMKGQLVVDQ